MICELVLRVDAPPRRAPGTGLAAALAFLVMVMAALASAGAAAAKPAFSAIAVDASTGAIIYQNHIDSPRYPASLTKVMTLYLLFEDMRAGKVTLSSRFTISKHAAAQQPSKVNLKPGATISVRDAIGVLVTKSANDIAVAVAEGLAGSESAFAARMTRTARAIGMTRTTFRNASGLPDNGQKTTARDMATLGLRIQRDFPKEFAYFATRSYTYAGRTHRNHNHLLGRLDGIDGIKTGYTRISGFNLISSIERDGKRMVGVVMGGQTGNSRNAYMTRMLNRLYKTAKLQTVQTVAALAGKPPGYVARPVRKALRVAKPPLPRPKPELAEAETETTITEVLEAKTEPAAEDAANTEAEAKAVVATKTTSETIVEASTFKTVVFKGTDTSETSRTSATGKIGDAARQVGEKALQVSQPADEKSDDHAVTWNIQIGAFPTAQGAKSRLDAALEAGIDALEGKAAFTMKAEVSGDTVYRARLSGFDESSARLACKQLKLKGMSCFTLAPRS